MSLLNAILEQHEQQPAPQQPELPETSKHYGGTKHEFFEVGSLPISSSHGVIPGKKGLFVNGNNINIVSDNYEIHQPKEIAAKFQSAVSSYGLELNRVLPNPSNGGLLLSAKYAKQKIGGEDHDVNLTFYTSHDGKYRTFLSLDTLRVACCNQLPALYRNKSRFIFSEKHYKNSLDMDLLAKTLEDIPESIAAQSDKINKLKDTKLGLDDFLSLWQDHYNVNKQAKQYQTKVDKLRSIYYHAPGQDICPANSAHKALNAITYMNTHEGRNTDYKQENALIKGGNDSLVWLDELITLEAYGDH